jgi:ABC-type sulfate/molybdate transport systems ATPase subunit
MTYGQRSAVKVEHAFGRGEGILIKISHHFALSWTVSVTALTDTRVVLIVGPRQAGKTMLVRQLAGADRPYITLDDAGALNAARADPVGFVRGIERAVIDESSARRS